jgi:hypothetical protein
VEEDENAEEDGDVDAADVVEKALTETAVIPSRVATGAKQQSSKPSKVRHSVMCAEQRL